MVTAARVPARIMVDALKVMVPVISYAGCNVSLEILLLGVGARHGQSDNIHLMWLLYW